jgi:molecular chaperone Hsp33
LREKEVVAPIESRAFRWHCGCSHRKILDILSSPMRADAEALFGGEERIQVNCPRCAAKYTVTREAMEARVGEEEA